MTGTGSVFTDSAEASRSPWHIVECRKSTRTSSRMNQRLRVTQSWPRVKFSPYSLHNSGEIINLSVLSFLVGKIGHTSFPIPQDGLEDAVGHVISLESCLDMANIQ